MAHKIASQQKKKYAGNGKGHYWILLKTVQNIHPMCLNDRKTHRICTKVQKPKRVGASTTSPYVSFLCWEILDERFLFHLTPALISQYSPTVLQRNRKKDLHPGIEPRSSVYPGQYANHYTTEVRLPKLRNRPDEGFEMLVFCAGKF